MRTVSIGLGVPLLVSLMVGAQDSATTESAAAARADLRKSAPGKDFVSNPEQDQAGRVGEQSDNDVPTNERHILGGSPVDPKEYVIGPVDLLKIAVWREPELSGQFSVRPDGKISLPLTNEIQAAGFTSEQLAAHITANLSKYMLHPLVTVAVEEVNSKKYFIHGEVQRPGVYRLVVPTTVLEALGNAGGFREFANTKNILILRGTQRLKFNYKNVTAGKDMEQNILLQSGDQLIVR